MNQKKIGEFLKKLRSEKTLTQEQLAEQLNVSRRTISRWETGSNLPDLGILIELADFYRVDLRELIDGERKSEQMNQELNETVIKVADYSNTEKQRFAKSVRMLSIAGLVALFIYIVMTLSEIADKSPILEYVSGFALGFAFSLITISVIVTGRYVSKIQAIKSRLIHRKSAEKN